MRKRPYRRIILVFPLSLTSYFVFGKSSKLEAIVVPVVSISEISESKKQIHHNSLASKLGDYFNLVSNEGFDEAQEMALIEHM